MEKIIVNPLSVRGLGDIVSPKILADFDVCDSVLASSTDTVNGVSMTVFTTSYRSGSRLLKSGDGFIVYTPDLTSMSVNVLLKTKSGSVISSASVSCIVDNETTLTATTNSSGEANFTIPFVEGESYYSLRFVYGGTSSVAGCSIYGRIFVGVPEELTLQGSDDLITVDETSRLTATLTGVDVSDERVPIPLATVNLYEEFSPAIRVSPDIVESGDLESLTVTLFDSVDGSRVVGETVSVYVDDGNSGLSLVTNKSVLSYSDGESCTLTATLLDENNTPISGEDVVFKANGVTLDTVQTDSSGVATYTYSAAGSGDIVFSVEGYGVSDTLTVEDCLTAKLTETTITNSTGTKISSIGLDTAYNIQNTDFSLEFDGMGNGVLNIGAKDYWSSSSANYRATIGYADGKNYWSTRTTSTTEGYGSNASTSTEYHYKITRESTTVKFYVDDTLIQTRTFSSFGSYSSWSIYSIIWGSGTQKVKNIKLKPL